MHRASVGIQIKEVVLEDHAELMGFLDGDRDSFRWLRPLPLPDNERFAHNHCTTSASAPESWMLWSASWSVLCHKSVRSRRSTFDASLRPRR